MGVGWAYCWLIGACTRTGLRPSDLRSAMGARCLAHAWVGTGAASVGLYWLYDWALNWMGIIRGISNCRFGRLHCRAA